MSHRILCLVLLLVLTSLWSIDAQASPAYQGSTVLVRVCYDNPSCTSPDDTNSHLATLDPYTEQVLANEWHAAAGLEALKAGVIAIRTFAYRNPGCGAFLRSNPELIPPYGSRLLDNRSQVYRFGGYSGSQNTITSNHSQARSQTANTYLYRATSSFACAKYDANTGNPTKACSSSECPDAADRNTLQEVADPVSDEVGSRISIGMAQNGSVAWGRGTAPWDYRQALTHYYANVVLANSSDTYYRWVWLNVGNDTVFTGYNGEDYYGPINPTPSCIYLGGSRPVSIRIQNTSRQTWDSSVKLSYRWYNGSTFINQGAEFSVPSLAPGADATINATLSPPNGASAGSSYTVRWDMKRGSTWFNSQNNWPTLNSSVCMLTDTTPPNNPPSGNISSPSGHVKNGWSAQTQITLTWSGASDGQTGVSGYSIAWDQNSTTVPDTGQDTTSPTASATLSHGNWYLHVRTRDNVGNWAGGATHYGPYGIDTTPPTSQVSNSPTTPGKSWLYLNVSGSDAGSGVGLIVVQYKIDNGPWQTYTSVTGAGPHTLLFTLSRYNRGHTYYFRTQATDQVGLIEPVGTADFSIYIAPNADPTGLSDVWLPIILKQN